MTAADADRAKADEVLSDVHSGWCGAHPGHVVRGAPYSGPCICRLKGKSDAIAAALAEARAPYDRLTADLRALAGEWEHEAQRHDDAEPISADGLTRMILAARHCREHAARLRGLVTGDGEEGAA